MIGCYHLETVECDNCRKCTACGVRGRHPCTASTGKPVVVPGFTTERLIEQLPVREPRRYAADDDEPEPSPSAKALTAVIVALENLPEDERWRVWQAMGHYFFPSRVSSG